MYLPTCMLQKSLKKEGRKKKKLITNWQGKHKHVKIKLNEV